MSYLLLLDTITPLNPIQKAIEDTEINKELNKQQEILAAETDNSIKINQLFETVYKTAEGVLVFITLLSYTGYISYIFLSFY
jgi:hypothetical protein